MADRDAADLSDPGVDGDPLIDAANDRSAHRATSTNMMLMRAIAFAAVAIAIFIIATALAPAEQADATANTNTTAAKGTLGRPFDANSHWQCLQRGTSYVPVRMRNGVVECRGVSSTDCDWKGSDSVCEASLGPVQGEFAVACPQEQLSNPDHWCHHAKRMLDAQAWTCLDMGEPHATVPVRRTADGGGRVQCLSRDAENCAWADGHAQCIQQNEGAHSPPTLRPGLCPADPPDGFCKRAHELLP